MRYSRQEILPLIPNNFNKISKNKKIIIVGCGGVGSVLAELLIRGGFTNLILIDNDLIDESNLGRQIFFEKDIGEYKAKVLEKYLKLINSKSNIISLLNLLDSKNISEIAKKTDLIVDASDNFNTRRIINEYCEIEKKSWLYNGAIKTQIITCLFNGKDKLFNKVFPNEITDEKCCEVGVLPSTTFTAASFAYTQILKYFINNNNNNNLIKLDIWTNKIFEIKI